MTIRTQRPSIQRCSDSGAACGRQPHCNPAVGPPSRNLGAAGISPRRNGATGDLAPRGVRSRKGPDSRLRPPPPGAVSRLSRPATRRDFKPAAQVTSRGRTTLASGALNNSSRVRQSLQRLARSSARSGSRENGCRRRERAWATSCARIAEPKPAGTNLAVMRMRRRSRRTTSVVLLRHPSLARGARSSSIASRAPAEEREGARTWDFECVR